MRGRWERFQQRLCEPVDGSSLGLLRIVFGALVAYEVVDLWRLAPGLYLAPPIRFGYEGFAFVAQSSAAMVHVAFWGAFLSAIAVMLGFCYRVSALALFVGFGYLFLLEEAIYLNHFYLIVLLSGLLVVLRADRWAAVDLLWRSRTNDGNVPFWNVLILRWQIVIVYFYGGLAKLNADWLRGEPLGEWLARRAEFPFFGQWLTERWVTLWVFSYGGLVFDLTIGFLLLSRRTRELALIPLMLFHVTNALVFNIGVFPWLMLGLTVIFFEPDTPRKFVDGVRAKWFARAGEEKERAAADPIPEWRKRAATLFFIGWIAIQALVPLRHWLYPGNVNWTEEGHRFAWRMKLRDKQGWLSFAVTDPSTGRTAPVTPLPGFAPEALQLNRTQFHRLIMCPRLIVQYAHHLHRNAHLIGMEDPEVRVLSLMSLNGRPHQMLIDPGVDLAKIEAPWFEHAEWVVPLAPDQPIGRYERIDPERFNKLFRSTFGAGASWEALGAGSR